MKNLISSIFSHEIKNSLTSIRFGIEMFDKYDLSKEEQKKNISDLLNTIDNTLNILEEYINFIKFQFVKLKYEKINLYSILEEIKTEITPFAQKKGVNIYIQKKDIFIISPKFWLKRAIYNIIYNAVKYNKRGGSVNIKIEPSMFGIYLSIQDTGMGINSKNLKSIFKFFERVDETQKGFGIGLALSKSVIENIGGKISVKSNENIGSNFILYIPNKPKEITIKKIAISLIPASVVLFLAVSYLPIYSQKYEKSVQGGYIVYSLEDGSILKFAQNSDYKMSAYKNLYNTKFTLSSTLKSGDMSLKAIKNKASIYVKNKEFNNLGTDFEIIRDDFTKVAVFEGKVVSANLALNKGQGSVIGDNIKVVKLLSAPKNINIKNGYLTFDRVKDAKKYKIILSKNINFNQIEDSFFSNKNKLKLKFNNDALYYIKVFAYDKYGLPSLPAIYKYINLSHYKKALKMLNIDINESILELESSVMTIKQHSSLPYYELAKILYIKKKYNQALKLIQKALLIQEKKEYYYLLLDIYSKLNNIQKIEENVNKIINKYPNDILLLFYKAKILFQKQQYKKTSKILFKILQQNPNFKEANALMAKTLRKLNKPEAKYYERLSK